MRIEQPGRPSPGTGGPDEEPSTADLVRGIADDATTLVKQEILLARQELTEGLAKVAKAKVAPERAQAELRETTADLAAEAKVAAAEVKADLTGSVKAVREEAAAAPARVKEAAGSAAGDVREAASKAKDQVAAKVRRDG